MNKTLSPSDLSADAVYAGVRYLEQQRRALALLEMLTTEAVEPRTSQIDQTLRGAEHTAREALEKRIRSAEAARDTALQAADEEFAAQRQSIEEQFERDTAELKESLTQASSRVSGQVRELLAAERRKRNERVLMADTVAPAVIEGHAKDLRAVERTLRGCLEQCEQLMARLETTCRRFGVSFPMPPESVEPPAGAKAADLLGRAAERTGAIERMRLPRLMAGFKPVLLGALIVAGLTGLAWLPSAAGLDLGVAPWIVPAAVGSASLIALLLIGRTLKRRAADETRAAVEATLHIIEQTRAAVEHERAAAQERFERRKAEALAQRERDVRAAEEALAGVEQQAEARHAESRAEMDREYGQKLDRLRQVRDKKLERAQRQHAAKRHAVLAEYERNVTAAREQFDRHCAHARRRWESAHQALRGEWQHAVDALQDLLRATNELPLAARGAPSHASDSCIANVPIGALEVEVSRIAERIRTQPDFPSGDGGRLRVPAILPLPVRGSLLIEAPREQRRASIDLLRAAIVRTMQALPPGKARFTIIDPIGLGENFAGFMHLVDYEEALLDGRIWTETEHIEARLANLTGHMETVIQKYLRNEFETIADYNAQAGELAEPLRFLVIADYPACFSETSLERLQRIVRSGARCGVFTLIVSENASGGAAPPLWDDLREASIHLRYADGAFRHADSELRPYKLVPETPPDEQRLTDFMHEIGSAAKDSLRVVVPFDAVRPAQDEIWSRSAVDEVAVPLGRSGAVRLQAFRVGAGLSQHALIAGKTGSGKSTLLHVLITNLALWYSPDEIEMYLIDFKQGVEFKSYVSHHLPHARAIAIESDREFGLSVLQRIQAEMKRRGELFRDAQVQDIAAYRAAAGEVMPRVLLIVDEFQVFFAEDDRLAQDAGVLLDQLVRQGRAFGIHVVLGSQSLAGNIALARSTLGQMAVRIALQCPEADAQLILDDTNTAARLLTRPGEAIYNDAGGLVEGNHPFQTAWLPDSQRSELLAPLPQLARQRRLHLPPTVVFEGNRPADLRENPLLAEALRAPPDDGRPPRAWLGAPVAIKDPSSVLLRPQPGANLLIVGQQDRSAMAVMHAALLSIAAQRSPEAARFVLLDGTPEDRASDSLFAAFEATAPQRVERVAYRDVARAIAELSSLVNERLERDQHDGPLIVLAIYALQRFRALRRSEDDFSFSDDDRPRPDKDLAAVLRDGPNVGVHVLAWCDTLANVERTLERGSLGEFDNRLLFQMSAADSSNLIDSPEANRLGPNRALLYSEERGLMEKLRPYAAPSADWLNSVGQELRRRAPRA